ncbi:MAG: multicopper oxidase domain-containing protein, partial [Myxococcota bacterium]
SGAVSAVVVTAGLAATMAAMSFSPTRGLLDRVRVEGGVVPAEQLDPETHAVIGATELDLGYPRGDVVLGPAERADLVLTTDGAVGEVLALRWEDVARGRHTMAMEGDVMVALDAPDDGTRPGRDVARIELVAPTGSSEPLRIAEGDPLLLAVGPGREGLPTEADVEWSGAGRVSLDERMDMWPDEAGVWQMSTWLGMDGVAWHPEHVGGSAQPLAPTARTAALGQVARIEVLSNSRMAHPYHLHGFSFVPRSITWWPNPEDDDYDPSAPPVRVTLDTVEFEDTIVIPGYASVELAVRFDDPAGDGSAAGRWMEHCHILQHGENGMASELVITP